MNRDTWLAYFDAAAEPVRFYLLDEASTQNETRAQQALGFEHDAWERVMDLVWAAVFESAPPSAFQEGIRGVAGNRDPLEVERVVSLEVLYPLADLLSWDLDARLQQLGVPAAAFQGRHRLSLRPMSYGAAVRRIATEARISLLGEEVVRRLREIFVSYLKRVRTVEQAQELLRRPTSEGGMGWSAEQAQAFLAAADATLRLVPVMSEDEYARWLQQTQRQAESERIQTKAAAKQQAAEAAAVPAGGPDEPAAAERRPMTSSASTALDRGIEEAYRLANVAGLDDYLAKRLRNVISTRLRGVRSPEQAKEVLVRDSKVGGLGREEPEAVRIMAVIEQMYAEYHDKIAAEEHAKVEGFVQEQQRRIEERQQAEAREREAWYQEKLASVAQGETGAVAALKAVMQGVRNVGPVCDAPSGRVQVSVEGGDVLPARVDAVQGAVRLVGLSEELAAMDISRFRRLAKQPEEARKKVLQMFQALRQESYDRWVEGIRRWRQSPLQQAYLETVARAFAEQRPVAEVAEALRAAGGQALTPEEVGVLIELNRELVF